jgi:cytochrome c oxidase subunit 4
MTADHSHAQASDAHEPHAPPHPEVHFPTWKTYRWVALILFVLTVGEVWIYYTPIKGTRLFAPALITLSVIKFTIVVSFYMHLKYDAKIFRGLFLGPLSVAIIVIISLLFLFGHLSLHAT